MYMITPEESPGERLLNVILEQHDSINAFSKVVGIPESTIRGWTNGSSMPRRSGLIKIAMSLGVSAEWIKTGLGSKRASNNNVASIRDSYALYESIDDSGPEKIYKIPLFDVRASAGSGNTTEAEPLQEWVPMLARWVPPHIPIKNLECIYLAGDSMEPTIRDGSVILIDTREQDPQTAPSGIFVLRLNGGVLVKRLQRLPGKFLRFSGDNKRSDSFDVDLTSVPDDFHLIGRVVWFETRIW